MENLHDSFNKFYEGKKCEDKLIVNDILKEVKKYDVFDIIAKLSALNLVPENQNKATIIEPIIASILTLPEEERKSKHKMSMGKFKKIIQNIENMNMKIAIDPPENTFIDRVMFYGNYNIFTGINYIPGYILQALINSLNINRKDFNVDFIRKVYKLIKFILEISNSVSRVVNIDINNLEKYDEINGIVVPNENQLDKLKESLIIEELKIDNILDEDLIDLLYSDFECEEIENILNLDNQKYFNKPFLKSNDGNVIILSISVLIPFLIHNIVILADKYNEKDKLINLYNNVVWKKCLDYFNILDNKKIKESSLDIELKNDISYYKEILLSGDNKQVLVVLGVFDDGTNYTKHSMFSKYNNNKIEKLINQRINFIIKKIERKGIKKDNIFLSIIYNSFGRSMAIGINKKLINQLICLNPFELKCISINERNQKFFITRYIKAKNKLINIEQVFGELPYIDVYTNCNYSFYVSDEFDPKNSILYLSAGDSIEYIVKSLKKENRHLVESYDNNYMIEVILEDEKRNIYVPDLINPKYLVISMLVEFKEIKIWIYSAKINNITELNIYRSIIDAISYWLEESKNIVDNKIVMEKYKKIKIVINGNPEDYFLNVKWEKNIEDSIFIEYNNEIILNINPETFYSFNKSDNSSEKQLVLKLLNEIFNLNDYDKIKINEIFLPKEKQKFFALDYEIYKYYKPIIRLQNRRINDNDVNELLDEVGKYILSLNKWDYGIVEEEDRNEITRLVVDYLYKILQEKIKVLNPSNFIELIYRDLEEKIYNMMMFQERHYIDTLCYPEKKTYIWTEFNEEQKISKALKFLLEYVVAQPPNGKEMLGEYEYEKILTICFLIVEWAYNNDLFIYKMFNTPIEILKSNRLGMKKDEFNNMGESMLNARMREFEYYSIDKWKNLMEKHEINFSELDRAFIYEDGYTFSEFLKVCNKIIEIGDEEESDVKKCMYQELIIKLSQELEGIEKEKIIKIIQYILLEKRKDFLIPPEGFRVEDIYPWRFNRELSFVRRPLVKRENEIIWGNRNVFHMMMFIFDLIKEGKLKVKSKEMKKYIGKVSKNRGEAFNNSIYNVLKTFPELIVSKKVKKINNKKIVDEKNNELGDIDILYINSKNKQIVVGEVKDFKLSKNPYEIYSEYLEMFVDKKNKKSYSTKLKRRTEWIKNHIQDVKNEYNLKGDKWKIYKVFIVNEHLISKNVFAKSENIIALSEISIKTLTNLQHELI